MRRQRINPGICDQRERLEQFEPCLKLVKQKHATDKPQMFKLEAGTCLNKSVLRYHRALAGNHQPSERYPGYRRSCL